MEGDTKLEDQKVPISIGAEVAPVGQFVSEEKCAEPEGPTGQETDGSPTKSKNQRKREKYLARRLVHRAIKRKRERDNRRVKRRTNKPVDRNMQLAKVKQPNEPSTSGCERNPTAKFKIAIHCGFEPWMTSKQLRSLAGQLRRVYSSNKKAISPVDLTFADITEDSSLMKICKELNTGFINYKVNITRECLPQLYTSKEAIYLCPDSPNVMKSVKENFVYVIGGLVDETITNSLSQGYAEFLGYRTERLPIDEYFEKGPKGTYKKVLSVNQVFDVLLDFVQIDGGDWIRALKKGIPKRSGFIPKRRAHDNEEDSSSVDYQL